jgi:hypothetical protein
MNPRVLVILQCKDCRWISLFPQGTECGNPFTIRADKTLQHIEDIPAWCPLGQLEPRKETK